MQSKYNKSKHVLVEQPEMEKPSTDLDSAYRVGWHYSHWWNRWDKYNSHVASLRTILCCSDFIGEDGELYTEGIDYEVAKVTSFEHPVAIPIPKEDDLWEELILGFIQHYASHTLDIVIAELKKNYTITKKIV